MGCAPSRDALRQLNRETATRYLFALRNINPIQLRKLAVRDGDRFILKLAVSASDLRLVGAVGCWGWDFDMALPAECEAIASPNASAIYVMHDDQFELCRITAMESRPRKRNDVLKWMMTLMISRMIVSRSSHTH
jgi:hypothetical protein